MKQQRRTTKKKPAQEKKPSECSVHPHCPIVAMGASAGGLEVFQDFFKAMPPQSGMAFVVVQHLDPRHETLMPELLAKVTTMPVCKVEDGLKVQANHVYVIAPNVSLSMEGCTLQVTPLQQMSDRKVIDHFFRSLAQDQHANVVGVILSGTGSDGTLGLKAIKEHGGLTIAQSADTAKFDSMPRNAMATGCVDYILPVEEMPARIVEYIKHINVRQQRKGAETIQVEAVKFLPKIFPILRKRTGHDFSRYKQSTVVRRIQRRMQVAYLDSVADYVERLHKDQHEVDELFKDLLIGVTQFFRDADSFEVLANTVIPSIFREKTKESSIRIWVPGCASGEEAYTFAILLAEYAATLPDNDVPKIQVFATDLDIDALDFARKGKYPRDIVDQIAPARLQRYFDKVDHGYQIIDEIREMCVFSPHNLIKDPPFSRLDLISCRNLLIYLEADLQKRLLPLFHYALNPCGYLFLGPSENVASRSELFRSVDQKHRIFQRKPTLLHAPVHLPLLEPGHVTKLQPTVSPQFIAPKEHSLARSIERVILEDYSPVSVVINEQGDVMYFSGDTGKYLQPPSGVPNNKLVAMARKNLRLELRTAIHRAITTKREVVRKVAVKTARRNQIVNLIVRPLDELGAEPELYIVLFQELIRSSPAAPVSTGEFNHPEHPVIKQLESELRTTKDDLQTTIEELETSNEELKSANEELLSMNEELQSGNEELQTSKEEVQSANDELHRKIEELDAAIAELKRAHEERMRFAAIVQSSDDAIVGKKLDGTVTSWNKAAERIFGFTAADMIGESILKIIPPDRHHEERSILDRLSRGERIDHYETVRLTKDRREIHVSLTSSPIRDAEGKVIGASKIARDITGQKDIERSLRRSEQLLSDFFENAAVGLHWVGSDGTILRANQTELSLLGYTKEEYVGHHISEFHADAPVISDILEKLTCGRTLDNYEARLRCKNGEIKHVLISSNVLWEDGKFVHTRCFTRDITEQKRVEQALRESEQRLRATFNQAAVGMAIAGLDSRLEQVNERFSEILGYTAEELAGREIGELTYPEDRPQTAQALGRLLKGEISDYGIEKRFVRKNGSIVWSRANVALLKDTSGNAQKIVEVIQDITRRKNAEEQLREARVRLEATLNAAEIGTWTWDLKTNRIVADKNLAQIFSLTEAEAAGSPAEVYIKNVYPDDRPKVQAAIEAVLKSETGRYKVDYRILQKGGSVRWVGARGTVQYDEAGKPASLPGVVVDITERKLAEEAVLRSEAQLRALADSIPQLAWMAEPDGHIFWYNRRWFDYTGTTMEQMAGWGWQTVHDPEILPRVLERWTASIKAGEPFEMEFPLRGADGVFRWFLTRSNPVRDAEGRIVRWFGTNTDVDQVRRARLALQEETRVLELLNTSGTAIASELNLESLVQKVTDAGTDLSGAKFGAFFYNVMNEQGESLLLYTLSGAPREAFAKFGLPRNTPVFNPTFRGEGVVRSNDITKDPRYGQMPPHQGMPKGHLPVRSYLAVPVISRSGEVIGGLFFGHPEPNIFNDRSERLIVGIAAQAAIAIDNARLYETSQKEIAERKRAEAELQRAKDQLEQRVQERTASLQDTTEQLETFCYTIAHDLRSPLRAQQSYAGILLEDYKDVLDENGRHYAERIISSAQRLDKLVNDLLAYSRVSRDELKFETVDLDKVVKDVEASMVDEIRNAKATISAKPLSPVRGYQPTLHLIITNLISNALKFVEPGVFPKIRIWSEPVADAVRLWIEDNGIGITPENAEKIFGVFQRLHSMDKYPGTGIGLAIVHKGVQRMEGRVGVESTFGKGSRFWIELPKA